MLRRMGLFVLLAALPLLGIAQAGYPTRPVKLVVPFAPGGATDLVGRLLAQKLTESLKQQVVVENRGGGGSTVGTELVAKSAPDGYTLVMAANTSMSTAPLLYPKLAYRPLEDFAHVARIGTFPNGFVVRADHPARSLAELLAMSKSKPGGVSYGSAGQGSAGHLTGELLKSMSGANLEHVPYKGTGPATTDLLGGAIEAMFDGMPTATQNVRAGKVRLLAVSGSDRLATFPDVPTMNEVVPGAIGVAWFGVSAPAQTPTSIVKLLEQEVIRAVRSDDVRAKLSDIGMTPGPLSSAEYAAYIAAETKKWAPVVASAKVRIE